ncbi:MAG: hypothetical protein KatS3mg004_0180 [Bryobacteraceae bacterium]|nr:MAG: hypothetical protein KatS3mg004_0180 [Bryobacteraceae bacterium]
MAAWEWRQERSESEPGSVIEVPGLPELFEQLCVAYPMLSRDSVRRLLRLPPQILAQTRDAAKQAEPCPKVGMPDGRT